MFAFLLILPTLAFVPIYFFIFPAIYIVIKKSLTGDFPHFNTDPFKINTNLLIVILIILATAVNKVIQWHDELSTIQLVPYTIAMLLTYFLARELDRKDLKLIVWFIVIEVFVVYVQYAVGVNTFFSSLDHFNENIIKNPHLMYNRRPLGLSANSSVIAYKLFLAYLILDYLKLKSKLYLVVRFLLILGVFFTFNRTVFLVFAIYVMFSILKIYSPIVENLLEGKIRRKRIKYLIFAVAAAFLLLLFVTLYFEQIYAQLTRGRSQGVDLSGRDNIWGGFVDFISENMFFGNGGKKYYVQYSDKLAHAHNSFLQIIATHGIFIFLLYVVLVVRNIRHSNLIFVLLILFYSMFQYGIFWGVSLMDIILFKLLFFNNRKELIEAKRSG